MVQIHLPEGSNGKTALISHIILWGFAVLLFSITIFVIITSIHEIAKW